MRKIEKVAVLGAGLMGLGIAAHLANLGHRVLLLDMLPPDLEKGEEKDKNNRNAFARRAIQKALQAQKLPPFYDEAAASRVEVGNLEDDLPKIVSCDWVVEAVVENLEIKRQLFAGVDKYRKHGSLLSSNTSGIPIHLMAEGRSEDFRVHFCGTHFFNPVRYMRLLEIIPGKDTLPEIIDFHMDYGSAILQKQTVLCNDTPGFIANRIGFFSGNLVTELTEKYALSIEEVDALTGPAIGRPKTGTFRLRDLTGVDLGVKFRESMMQNLLPDDEFAQRIKDKPLPGYWNYLVEKGYLGNKTGQGFYKKIIDEEGQASFLAFNLKTLTYEPAKFPDLPSLKIGQSIGPLGDRIKAMMASNDKGGQFLAEYFAEFFAYMSNRIPEISDHLYSVDNALKSGFNWEQGAFEIWDEVGIQDGIELAAKYKAKVANWVKTMLGSGKDSFYIERDGQRYCYQPASGSYEMVY